MNPTEKSEAIIAKTQDVILEALSGKSVGKTALDAALTIYGLIITGASRQMGTPDVDAFAQDTFEE